MSETLEKKIKVYDKYQMMGETSMRMLVTHITKRLMEDKTNWMLLAQAARNEDRDGLCQFLDMYTRELFLKLPYATINEDETNAPNLAR